MMMKVVINVCYGGFGLSPKALLKLYELGSPVVEAHEPKKYYGGRKGWEKEFEADKKRDGFRPMVIAPDGKILTDSGIRGEQNRACPHLVKIVEEMGDEANSQCASLHVVEIPDGTDYVIEEYDGLEHIAEAHQTWR